MSETTFENAKTGDRVYSPLFKSVNPGDKTNAIIVNALNYPAPLSNHYIFAIGINPDISIEGVGRPSFTKLGEYYDGGGQVLFWSNPIKEMPTRPD